MGDRTGRSVPWVPSVIIGLLASTLLVLPFAGLPGPVLPGLTPFFVAGVVTTEAATAFLLFSWANDARTWALLLLASAYLLSSCLMILYLLTFPGALTSLEPLVGSSQSAGWAFVAWTNGFGGLTMAAVAHQALCGNRRIPRAWIRRSVWIVAFCVAMVSAGYGAVVIGWADALPVLVVDGRFTFSGQALRVLGLCLMLLGCVISLVWLRDDHELYQWIALCLTTLCCANILTAFGGARYTVGWSVARVSWLLSALVLFMFFMCQFVRRHHLLMDTRQTLERAVQQRTADLRQTIRQRDVLLREVYHRVKNNLQVVDSLIAMEARRFTDEDAKDAMADLRNRVFALGLVHQQLMSSDDLEHFSLASFLGELCDNISASLSLMEKGIALRVDVAPLMTNLDFAIPVGLLTTELLTNAVKHAKPTEVHVSLRATDQRTCILSVEDNGSDVGGNRRRLGDGLGTGSRIVNGLTRQLEGRMNIENENGMCVSILIPLPDVA